MTIARITTIAAVVCAAMGVATQAEAAKRKLAGYIEVKGCAYWVPVCGTVMGSGPDTYVLSGTPVPLHTPVKVFGRKIGNINLCWRPGRAGGGDSLGALEI
jgi:hypothetical protein